MGIRSVRIRPLFAGLALGGAILAGCSGAAKDASVGGDSSSASDSSTVDTSGSCDTDTFTPGYGVFAITTVLADEFTASVEHDLDNNMFIQLWREPDEPDPFDCIHNDTSVEGIEARMTDLDLVMEFQVPGGWICAQTSGSSGISDDPSGDHALCGGETPPIYVTPCTWYDVDMIVTCRREHNEGD